MFLLKILSAFIMLKMYNIVIAYDYLDFDDDVRSDYYEDYYEEETTTVTNDESGNRIRRYESKSPVIKVLSPEEIREVRAALDQLLAGTEHGKPLTPHSVIETTTYKSQNTEAFNTSTTDFDIEISTLSITEASDTKILLTMHPIDTDVILSAYPTKAKLFEHKLTTNNHFKNTTNKLTPKRTSSKPIRTQHKKERVNPFLIEDERANLRQATTITTEATENNTDVTTETTATETTLTTETRVTKSRELDMPRLLSIIADLANEFESNLTRKLNETLYNMSIPTCTTPTTEAPVTSEYDANYTGVTVAKCFVCGLDIHGVPRHAHCADAFAGDFLPLVPVDPTAKGMISTFRKYCKYANVRGYTFNQTHPRAIYGRWTGGCAVRWIDLSGIYTQRTCRNRLQPTLGKHFASKRMAKLERSLWNIENGCIVSPMATLVPLSRGISLYARFHACVCTGNWCNTSIVNKPWMVCHFLMLIVMIIRKNR